MLKNLVSLFGGLVGGFLGEVAKRQHVSINSVNGVQFVKFMDEKTGVHFVVANEYGELNVVVSFNGIKKNKRVSSVEAMEILENPFKFLGIETEEKEECHEVCDCCGGRHNLVLGQGTLFDEYMYICQDCLSRAMAEELGY